MDSSPPDRATLNRFFSCTEADRENARKASGRADPPLDATQSALPVMRQQQQQQSQQQDILAYWRGWQNDVVLGAIESPKPQKDHSADKPFLGGDFSLSELMNALPSDRLENGSCDVRDLPPLAAACMTPRSETSSSADARAHQVRKLLAEGADPRERDPVFGRNPLHWACLHADLAVVRMIVDALKNTANASSTSPQQASAGVAAEINHRDVNGLTPLEAVLALRPANLQEHAEMASCLIAQGADFSCLPRKGAELLFSDFLTVDIARRVLATGVAVDIRDAIGCTPLLKVTLAGNLPLLKFLLEQGANPRQRIFFGGTLLNQHGIGTETAELLLQHGADANLGDDLGMTPLMFACQDKNLPLIRLLIRHGASVRARSADGLRVADYAADEETLRFIETEAGLAPGTRLADD